MNANGWSYRLAHDDAADYRTSATHYFVDGWSLCGKMSRKRGTWRFDLRDDLVGCGLCERKLAKVKP